MSLKEAMWEPCEGALLAGNVPVLIGPPGIGKTAGLSDLAARHNLKLITVILSIREPSDIAGLPVVTGESYKVQVNGKEVVLPATRIAPPDYVLEAINCREEGYAGCIIFFDEYNTAVPSVQAATLRIINEREVAGISLPREYIYMALAMNPVGQAAGGWDLSLATLSRVQHIEVNPGDVDANEFANSFVSYWGCPPKLYGLGKEIPEPVWKTRREQVAAFLQQNPNKAIVLPRDSQGHTGGFPTLRTWDMVSRFLAGLDTRPEKPSQGLLQKGIAGCIGEGMAQEYLDFISTARMPSPTEVLANPALLRDNWPSRNDKLMMLADGIVTNIKNQPNETQWFAAWIIVEIIAGKGSNDVAASMARSLANFWAINGGKYSLQAPPVETLRKLGLQR